MGDAMGLGYAIDPSLVEQGLTLLDQFETRAGSEPIFNLDAVRSLIKIRGRMDPHKIWLWRGNIDRLEKEARNLRKRNRAWERTFLTTHPTLDNPERGTALDQLVTDVGAWGDAVEMNLIRIKEH